MDLIRPWFHPGQVLAEDDLNRLVEYIEGLVMLQNLAGGVGVRSGLTVSVRRGRSTRVRVEPGFAVDSQGWLLHLAEPAMVDLEAGFSGSIVLRRRSTPCDVAPVVAASDTDEPTVPTATRITSEVVAVDVPDDADVVLRKFRRGGSVT